MARNSQFSKVINKIIGKKLYEIRIRKGYSRQSLANAIDVTQQQVTKYERGEDKITIGRLYLAVTFLEEDFIKFLSSVFYEAKIMQEESATLNTEYQRLTMEIARDLHSIKNERQLRAIQGIVKAFKNNN